MRGRKPKPTALKQICNPGRRPIPVEPDLPRSVGEPPQWLDDGARREWFAVANWLDSAGIATPIDRQALACYCQAVSRWAEAESIIKAAGITQSGKGGLRKHPAVSVAHDSMLLIQKFASEFGMTPATRARIHAQGKKQNQAEDKERFFRTG